MAQPGALQDDGDGRPIRKFDQQTQFTAKGAYVSAQCGNQRVVAIFQPGYPALSHADGGGDINLSAIDGLAELTQRYLANLFPRFTVLRGLLPGSAHGRTFELDL